jgi:hypothetical protein
MNRVMKGKVSEPDCGESPSEVSTVAASGDIVEALSRGSVEDGDWSSDGSYVTLASDSNVVGSAHPYLLRPFCQRLGHPLRCTTAAAAHSGYRWWSRPWVHETTKYTVPGAI